MNHNLVALLAVTVGAAVAVVVAYRAPGLGYPALAIPFARFAIGCVGFTIGVYLVSLFSLIFERTRPAFSPSRTTFFALLGAVIGFVLNFTVLPWAAEAFRNPAGAETGVNLVAWEFYLIFPLVGSFLSSRVGFFIHGRMSRWMRWGFLVSFVVVLVAGYLFFGKKA